MKIRTSCLDQGLIWAIDDVIGGLYAINQKTLETECVIDCQKLFPCGKVSVLSLFKWREKYIVIVPQEINRKWIIYNKITGEIEYKKVTERKCQEILLATDHEKKYLYFLPIYTYDPILIVDLNTLTCLQKIEGWSRGVAGNCTKTGWKGINSGQYIFFTIINTKILVRMNCETRKIDLLKLDISENLIDVDYAYGELWILPVKGDQIYQIDENGMVVRNARLFVRDDKSVLPNFARIVAQKRYLFLFPFYRKGIYVYDKWKEIMHIISEENSVLEKEDKQISLRYWEYYIRDNCICFLPFRENYVEIDLNTLAYKEEKILYPNIWSNEEKIRNCIWNHIYAKDIFIRESDECGMKTFLEYIYYEINTKRLSKNSYISKSVWNIVKS